MRSRFEACVTPEDWDAIICTLAAEAKGGNVGAVRELSPWIVGRVPEEAKLLGDETAPLHIIIEE